MQEMWKQIRDFPMYDVSNAGQVRSHKQGYLHLLKPGLSKSGYFSVDLSHNLKHGTQNIHILVLEAFISPRPTGLIANHKDGIKTNNCPDNLEWTTKSEDVKHAIRNGLMTNPVMLGETNWNAKLKDGEVWLIKKLLWFEISHRNIAKMFQVTKSTITSINLALTWSYIKFEPTEKDRLLYRKKYNL